MSRLRVLLVAGAMLAGAAPAALAQSACAGIADPGARLACYDRAGRASQPALTPPPRSAAPDRSNACTRASPCIGPRGGVYYFTASGNKQYLPR